MTPEYLSLDELLGRLNWLARLSIAAVLYRRTPEPLLWAANDVARPLLHSGSHNAVHEHWTWQTIESKRAPAVHPALCLAEGGRQSLTCWMIFEHARRRAVRLTGTAVVDDTGTGWTLLVLEDVSDRFDTHAALLRSQQCVRQIIHATPVGICITDVNGRFELVNPAYCTLYGYQEKALLGQPFTMVEPQEHRALMHKLHQRFTEGEEALRGEWDVRARDGEQHTILADAVRIEDEKGQARLVTFVMDITQRKQLEQALAGKNTRLEYLATHDELTGIRNRRFGMTGLHAAMRQADREGSRLAIALIDIDHFKLVNDRYGHGTGDRLLRELSELIASKLRASDLLVRWGGEEFLIILPGDDAEGAHQALLRIREVLAHHDLTEQSLHITFSAGIATFSGQTLDALIDQADRGLYRAKAAGRDRIEC